MAYSKTNWVNNTTPINETNLNKIESGIKNNDINIGEENYDNTKTYEVGDIVRYNEKIYKCITAITTAENFDISKWEQTNIVEIVQSEKSKIYKLIEALSTPIVGEGENITLNDTAEKRFEKFDIEGNSEQETRSGKNYLNTLAKYKAGEKVTVDGITYIFNEDGSITCNGTATADSVLTFSLGLQTINGSSKKIVGMLTGTQVPKKLSILAYTSDWSKNTFTLLSNVNKNITTNMQENIDYTIFRIIVYKETTLNNQTIYYQILDTSVNDLTYEQYGASPSPDYPSEIKTVGSNGCLKVTICNKNIFKETYNRKDVTSAYVPIVKGECFLEKDKTYVVSFDTTNNGGTVYLGEDFFQYINHFTVKCDGTRKFFTVKAKEFGYVTDITVLKTRVDTTNAYNISNVMISEYENDTDTEYVQHEEQSYIMPTQKEMLQGDYFDYDNEEEVHTWGKKILDGTEEINLHWDISDKHGYRIAIDNIKKTTSSADKSLIISNSYKAYIQDDLFNLKYKAYGISNRYNNSEVIIRNDDITTVADFKANLKSQYDAETPVIVYYKLQTPTRLKFTDEQKAVAKKLNNAKAYKGVTHIYSNDAVSPNCYVEAAKDLTTLIQ